MMISKKTLLKTLFLPKLRAESWNLEQSLSRTLNQVLSSHLCCPRPPSCRRTGGVSAGSLLRLAVLPAALPSSAGPLLPQTSAVQTGSARCTRTQTGQLRLHPAPLEQCYVIYKGLRVIIFSLCYGFAAGKFVKISFLVLYLLKWDLLFSVPEEDVRCFILLTKRLLFLKWFQFELNTLPSQRSELLVTTFSSH